MSRKQLPPWGDDPLSKTLSDAAYNERVTAANFPTVYEFLKRVHVAFVQAGQALEKDSDINHLVPRFLLIRTHSSIIAAIRSAMCGQAPEASAVLRAGIEQSWYALHMAVDSSFARTEIWLRRNDDERTTNKCKSEFTIRNVRSTHELLDNKTAKQIKDIYERLIDFGAHPNQMGVFSAIKKSKQPDQITFHVGILTAEKTSMLATLRFVGAVAIGSLKIFALIWPERFALVGLNEQIEGLVHELNTVFKKAARAT
jgi:hypothetical protein